MNTTCLNLEIQCNKTHTERLTVILVASKQILFPGCKLRNKCVSWCLNQRGTKITIFIMGNLPASYRPVLPYFTYLGVIPSSDILLSSHPAISLTHLCDNLLSQEHKTALFCHVGKEVFKIYFFHNSIFMNYMLFSLNTNAKKKKDNLVNLYVTD